MNRVIINDTAILPILNHCFGNTPYKSPNGTIKKGFINIKSIYNNIDLLTQCVDIISPHIISQVICAPDHGISPLVGGLCLKLKKQGVFVRQLPKAYYLSYGISQNTNNPFLIGGLIGPNTKVQIVDDVINSGSTILKARDKLALSNIEVESVVAIIAMKNLTSVLSDFERNGIPSVTILANYQFLKSHNFIL